MRRTCFVRPAARSGCGSCRTTLRLATSSAAPARGVRPQGQEAPAGTVDLGRRYGVTTARLARNHPGVFDILIQQVPAAGHIPLMRTGCACARRRCWTSGATPSFCDSRAERAAVLKAMRCVDAIGRAEFIGGQRLCLRTACEGTPLTARPSPSPSPPSRRPCPRD